MNTMTDVVSRAWSRAFCQVVCARQRAKALLQEESAQGTTEYALGGRTRGDRDHCHRRV